jgi:hypothetical protein
MTGMKMLGRRRLSRTLVNGSKTEYETKKMVSAALYWLSVISRSSCRCAIFALPILVLQHVRRTPTTGKAGAHLSKNEIR